MTSVAAVDRLEEVTDSQLTGIELRGGSRGGGGGGGGGGWGGCNPPFQTRNENYH